MSRAVLAAVLLLAAAPARASFIENEVAAASLTEVVKNARWALNEGGRDNAAFKASVTAAFKGTENWASDAEDYYGVRADLLARAESLETTLDVVMKDNSLETAEKTAKRLAKLKPTADTLDADLRFYAALPHLAASPKRAEAQAAMRLLSKNRAFGEAAVFLRSKSADIRPFMRTSPSAPKARPKR